MPDPDVYVNARTTTYPGGSPVASVQISLYTSGGSFITTATTDANGDAFLGNRSPATYEIRITAPAPGAVLNGTVQNIVVPSSSTDQYFDVYVDNSSLPTSSDSLFCRCSGYFKDLYGQPIENLQIKLSEDNTSPQLMYYSGSDTTHGIIPTARTVTTDVNGYAVVDLLRDQLYTVFIGRLENHSRTIKVPDLTAASLPDVIWQSTERVEWKDSGNTITPVSAPTLTVSVGVPKELTFDTIFRSGVIEPGAVEIELASSDTAVMTIAVAGSTLTVTGVSAGSATVTLTRTEPGDGQGLITYPVPTLRGSLAVTVNP